jgi:hypothetical protein
VTCASIKPCAPSGQEPRPKPANNYARLLAILERNVARAHEPELIRRLREAIRATEERRRGQA